MRLSHRLLAAAITLGLVAGHSLAGQTPGAPATATGNQAQPPQTVSPSQTPAPAPTSPVTSPPASIIDPCRPGGQEYEPMDEKVPCSAAAKKTYTVPSGTKVLLQLRSAINTKSAKAGDGVYLASTFPVVVGNRVMIPEGVYVQGVVDRVARAGHVKGRAQLDMHFTSIIFPNGTVVEIPGVVDSLPGAKKQTVKDDGEGTIQQDGDKGRNAGEVAKISVPTGATVGAIAGLGSGHPLGGGLVGIGAGLAAAGLVSLFTRGADVNIESGTQVEMVLQRPLELQEENLLAAGAPGSPATLVPASTQHKPIPKPGHVRVICPPEGLGCEE